MARLGDDRGRGDGIPSLPPTETAPAMRSGLLAGLRQAVAGDLRVDAQVVQRARDDRHGDGGRLAAVRGRVGVVVTLACGNSADDQPGMANL